MKKFRFLQPDYFASICRDSNHTMRGSDRLLHHHSQRGAKDPDWYNDILHNFLACYSVSPIFGCEQSLDNHEEILATGMRVEAIRGSGGAPSGGDCHVAATRLLAMTQAEKVQYLFCL